LVGGLLFVIGCAISFFLFANKMAILIGLPSWFYEKGIIPSLGDLEDHTIFSTIKLLADIIFWLLIGFFAVINKKFRWAVILILLIITVFTIYSFYIKSRSVQTGMPSQTTCSSDKDCKIFILEEITPAIPGELPYTSQGCFNKDFRDNVIYKIIETKEDTTKCACRNNDCVFINP